MLNVVPGAVLMAGTGRTSAAPAGYVEPSQPGVAAGPTAGILRANKVIITGAGGGEFIYDAAGNLRSANVGANTTDPIQGITCFQGFSTFNGFGAVITLLSTSLAAYFQYVDQGSAVQGNLSLSQASRPVTDPVTSVAVPAGEQIWNGTLQFITPVAHPGSIGVSGAGAFFLGFMLFQQSAGYVFDTQIVASGFIAAQNPAPAANSAEVWHSLGTLALYTVNTGRYRLTSEGELELDIVVTSAGANASSTAFSTTLAAPYVPITVNRNPAMGTNRPVTAGDVSPRLVVSVAGLVSVVQTANVTATLSYQGVLPLN